MGKAVAALEWNSKGATDNGRSNVARPLAAARRGPYEVG